MMPLGCLCQLQSVSLDFFSKHSLLNWIDMQRVDVVVYLEQRLPEVVEKIRCNPWIGHSGRTQ